MTHISKHYIQIVDPDPSRDFSKGHNTQLNYRRRVSIDKYERFNPKALKGGKERPFLILGKIGKKKIF